LDNVKEVRYAIGIIRDDSIRVYRRVGAQLVSGSYQSLLPKFDHQVVVEGHGAAWFSAEEIEAFRTLIAISSSRGLTPNLRREIEFACNVSEELADKILRAPDMVQLLNLEVSS
jgi:hypothetical protein